mgnify:CR=1 FL=1
MARQSEQKQYIRLSVDLSRSMFQALAERSTQEGQSKVAFVRSALSRELRPALDRIWEEEKDK